MHITRFGLTLYFSLTFVPGNPLVGNKKKTKTGYVLGNYITVDNKASSSSGNNSQNKKYGFSIFTLVFLGIFNNDFAEVAALFLTFRPITEKRLPDMSQKNILQLVRLRQVTQMIILHQHRILVQMRNNCGICTIPVCSVFYFIFIRRPVICTGSC
mgnify:CR=1 FL=1